METKEFTATAGGGAVEITVSGTREVLKVKLAEEVVDPDDIEMLEDMVMVAMNEAVKKADAAIANNADDKAECVKVAVKKIDQAVTKGILHKNNAARKKSRFTKMLNDAKALILRKKHAFISPNACYFFI